ncbi:MAG: Leucyl-tRNA synthetase [Candidatus Magasanikbacteria bacterium GW2011_GWC2_40_17]|uniref:Leucine--tRNA ligase n=1 Tax=Candidatus Magasanikbacteria bacterium GW2011_GWA2_42_32 TaxID=1619039 RepID=A0A0G1A7R1_9BACT|nr:MAG: Leucyl-tRNA synthetase [Candidatus Magasanikbacteria bacterium GW2011_GWC2_40_17]KKS56979.1 MAG: Leucyl-tRNA synthetase [Candidatus Magasanikbacteria bacterium GW2011_GWA2_42_32]OGH85707.1 MAG: leucine--tRNA ligase [Candidatus Magasanikbacteria bacterium RIFOXYB2_FULL_38_10]
MKKYNHKEIEKKWQKEWIKKGIYKTKEGGDKPKYYVLDMFPYPSGAGLHVGHPKGYIATDVIARMKMMQGFNVLHPMGWDAFGLPAENYAIKNKVHPSVATEKNIKIFKKQLELLGFTYDWDREVNTTDPAYYKWTQWAFLEMFKKGLVYESNEPINWCPGCKTGLANEDLEGGLCERCGSVVERKPLRQWVIRITDYAEKLLQGLDNLPEWEESIKEMQRNWIGKSEGALVTFKLKAGGQEESLEVFTTRPDTLFGATYVVLTPEHPLLHSLEGEICNLVEVKDYVALAKNKSELERTDLAKEKTGVKLEDVVAINPVNGEELPVWVADYVLMGYGTGAIMAVPAHDERDYEFAKKYGLGIKEVVAKQFGEVETNFIRADGVAGVLLNKKGQIYVLKRPNGEYELPAGRYNKGESDEQTLRREIIEETGFLDFERGDFLGTIQANFYIEDLKIQRLKYQKGYIVNLKSEKQQPPQMEDLEDYTGEWQNLKDALSLFEKYNIQGQVEFIRRAIDPKEKCFAGEGIAINSDFLDGLSTLEAKEKIINWLKEKGLGEKKVQYKIRDWVFSRQRYWGEPIPLVKCEKDGWVSVPEKDLPLELPKVKKYEPTGTGESPLANITKWVNTTCPKCGGPAKRETNTMPQWAGSCWYYLRYEDPNNKKALVDKNLEKYWSPINLYVGGAEHATRHLIYARFWHKFLFDIGAVNYDEPFTKLQHVGLILAEDGRKMSKRWNNVINPNDVVGEYGADAMRLYEMFMGPFGQPCAWSTKGVVGMRRFLERIWNFSQKIKWAKETNKELRREIEKTIKKVTDDIGELKFNTAVSQLMIFVNNLNDSSIISQDDFGKFIKLLAPFAPHLAEDIWQELGNKKTIFQSAWPEFNAELAKDETFILAVQVNGKLRDTLEVAVDITEEEAKRIVLSSEKIKKWLEGKEPKKIIFVKGKLLSIVV